MRRGRTFRASPCNRCLFGNDHLSPTHRLIYLQLASLKLMFDRASHHSRANLDATKSDKDSQSPNALSLDEFCNFLLDATGSSHAASSLLFRRADYDSKNAVTWDDVLPHILKKHSTEKANKRDIPYSINMLRVDPDISHQKVLALFFASRTFSLRFRIKWPA